MYMILKGDMLGQSMNKRAKTFKKSDCPYCHGEGYIHPSPTYKSKKCNHKISEDILSSRISNAIYFVKEKEKALAKEQAELNELRRVYDKYFVDHENGRQSTIEDFQEE